MIEDTLIRKITTELVRAAEAKISGRAWSRGTWVSTMVREGQLVPVRSRTVLRSGDVILVLIDPGQSTSNVCAVFSAEQPASTGLDGLSGVRCTFRSVEQLF